MSQSDPTSDIFRPIFKLRSSDRVAKIIRKAIVQGRFRPGERLPPERMLAERFQVTRNTVREALRQLEQLRLVSIRQGSGVKVEDYLSTAGLEFLAVLLEPEPAGAPIRDLLEARAVVGEAILRHAVEHAPIDALDDFAHAVDDFAEEARREIPEVHRLQELELEVHSRLVRASGNRAFALLWNSLRYVYERVAPLFEVVVGEPEQLARCYEQTALALSKGDRAAASEAIARIFTMTDIDVSSEEE